MKESGDGHANIEIKNFLVDICCIKYGICLPPIVNTQLENIGPISAFEFVSKVFEQEGIDKEMNNKLFKKVLNDFTKSVGHQFP